MVRKLALSPVLSLDPKRIAATSTAIAIHVVVLMMLMLPAQTAPTPVDRETEMVVVPDVKIVPLVPIPVTVTPRTPTRVTERQPHDQPPPLSVDTTASPLDSLPPIEPPAGIEGDSTSIRPPSIFAQIAMDRAPAPPYPLQARRSHTTGTVTLRVRVDTSGKPVEVTIENSSGSRLLDESARKFVLARWFFIPARQDGVPVEALALVPISFELD